MEEKLEQEVATWTALLEAAKTDEEVAAIFGRLRALGPEGAQVRQAIMAPIFEKMEREGVLEATGERDANGQMIYRSLIYEGEEAHAQEGEAT